MTNRRLQREYNRYNKLWFKKKLPKIFVSFGKLDKYVLGETRFTENGRLPYRIILNRNLRVGWVEKLAYTTLIHEMVHVKLGCKIACIDEVFYKEIKKLADAGAFDDLI